MHEADGVILADAGGGKPAPAAPVAACVAKAFGDRLAEVRSAMEELADRFVRGELHRVGFRLYEAFRLEVPADMRGWGANIWANSTSRRFGTRGSSRQRPRRPTAA